MTNQLLFGVVIVPAIIGLVQVLKEAGVPSQFAPIAAVGFGVLAGIAQLEAGTYSWIPAVVIGVSLGLSAVGLYSASSAAIPALLNKNSTEPATPAPTTTSTPTAR